MNAPFAGDLPKGIQKITPLPDRSLEELWDSIIVEAEMKERLLSQAVLNFTMRPKMSRAVLPLHGVLLLVGQNFARARVGQPNSSGFQGWKLPTGGGGSAWIDELRHGEDATGSL